MPLFTWGRFSFLTSCWLPPLTCHPDNYFSKYCGQVIYMCTCAVCACGSKSVKYIKRLKILLQNLEKNAMNILVYQKGNMFF